MVPDTREAILASARATAQAHGYTGISFRELAKAVGVKSASVHYHFPTKTDLGAELARRYTEDAGAELAQIHAHTSELTARLDLYAGLFRRALENENRMCMCGLMAAEDHDLPQAVRAEVRAFADLNIAWLSQILVEADSGADRDAAERRARAIYAAIGGAQLAARGRGDIARYDEIVASYRRFGLIPG